MKKLLSLPIKLWLAILVTTISTLSFQQLSYSFEVAPVQLNNREASTSKLREAEAHNNKGVELAEQGNLPQAIAAFNYAIKIYPSYENAHNNLGLALGSQNQFSAAVDAFRQALTINPSNYETYNNLGIALGSQGKFSEAVSAFNQAIKINPDDPTSRQNLGVAFWSQGKLPEAMTSLQTARKLYLERKNSEGVNHIDEILQQLQSP